MTNLNWAQLRHEMLLSTKRIECCNASYWDKQAKSYYKSAVQMEDLTLKQLNRISLLPENSVLDVGAGTGRLTLPVAKQVQQVTALEPSRNMLSILETDAKKNGLNNIHFINKTLEDFDTCSGSISFDVVIASFSFFMVDMEKALTKMNNLAKNSVYLFSSASRLMDNELLKLTPNEPIDRHSDYFYINNILLDLGILGNVEIWDFIATQRFTDLDQAVSKFTDLYRIPASKVDELRNCLSKKLVRKDDELLFKSKSKMAIIWWTKTQ